MTIIQLPIRNGITSNYWIPGSILLTNSILSTWSNQKAHTTKVWNLWYIRSAMLNLVKAKVLVGIETVKIFATSKIPLKRRQAVFTIRWRFKYSSQMIMMRYILRIVTLIHIPTAPNYYRDSANLNQKTGYEKR